MICQPVSVVAVWCAGAWLNGLAGGDGADLREAVAHLRRVRTDALYKSTVTLLHSLLSHFTVKLEAVIVECEHYW